MVLTYENIIEITTILCSLIVLDITFLEKIQNTHDNP